MILETADPNFMKIIDERTPKHDRVNVRVVHSDGSITSERLTRSSEGRVMLMQKRRKRYGFYPNWKEWYYAIIFPERGITLNEKWIKGWTKVLKRLEKSGLWENVAKDVRDALDIGMDKIKKAEKQYWERYTDKPDMPYGEKDRLNTEAIREVDERLVKYREDGTPYPRTDILWYMDNPPKVKKMYFGKYQNERKLAEIAEAMKNKTSILVSANGRFINGYDVHIEYNAEAKKAWYSEEYRGCGNGHYYLALDATHALFYEDD